MLKKRTLSARQIQKKEKQLKLMYHHLASYWQFFEEMDCPVIKGSLVSDQNNANNAFMTRYGRRLKKDRNFSLDDLRNIHPEFNFSELEDAILHIQKTKDVESFESFVTLPDESMYWIKVVLIPLPNAQGNISDVLGAVIDTTSEHATDEQMDLLANLPCGIHRCYLSEPIHMEYASKGLYEMLGYSKAELDSKMGPEKKYSEVVHPEDRQDFVNFIRGAAKQEGKFSIIYRMIRKDGSVIYVRDDTEIKRAASGVLYGYSFVVDISDYQKEREAVSEQLKVAEKKVLFQRRKMENLEEDLKEARLKSSLSQMQPHFLYNALASIREIILVDPQYASDLVYDFSTHLRACIRSMSNNDLVPFEEELNNINAYIKIEKMRFGEKLKVDYNIEDRNFSIVPLSIQPLVENAIRHGIYERGAKGGKVTISTRKQENQHYIFIEDDGVGFDYKKIRRETESHQRDSTGLANVIFRLEKMCDAKVDIQSQIGKGTKITIMIPCTAF